MAVEASLDFAVFDLIFLIGLTTWHILQSREPHVKALVDRHLITRKIMNSGKLQIMSYILETRKSD